MKYYYVFLFLIAASTIVMAEIEIVSDTGRGSTKEEACQEAVGRATYQASLFGKAIKDTTCSCSQTEGTEIIKPTWTCRAKAEVVK
jgi:hypothetical protein